MATGETAALVRNIAVQSAGVKLPLDSMFALLRPHLSKVQDRYKEQALRTLARYEYYRAMGDIEG